MRSKMFILSLLIIVLLGVIFFSVFYYNQHWKLSKNEFLFSKEVSKEDDGILLEEVDKLEKNKIYYFIFYTHFQSSKKIILGLNTPNKLVNDPIISIELYLKNEKQQIILLNDRVKSLSDSLPVYFLADRI